MKTVFWIATSILLTGEYMAIKAFVNIYFKNYNGGPSSSSGSIWYYPVIGFIVLLSGFIFYYLDKFKLAAAIVGLPILLVMLFLFFRLILPALMGERMQ